MNIYIFYTSTIFTVLSYFLNITASSITHKW